VPAPARPAAVRSAGFLAVAVTGWLVSAADDSPDADIGLGMLLMAWLLLTAAVWAGADGWRSAGQGRPDREGLLVWLLAAAAFGVLISVATGVGVAVSEGADGGVPVGVLLSASFTWATLVAAPAAVAYGLVRALAGRRRPRSRI